MFKDKYGLTQAVLDGRKTMTRRIVPKKVISSSKVYVQLRDKGDNINDLRIEYIKQKSPYKIGEVLAITQSYRQIEKEIEKRNQLVSVMKEIENEWRKKTDWNAVFSEQNANGNIKRIWCQSGTDQPVGKEDFIKTTTDILSNYES